MLPASAWLDIIELANNHLESYLKGAFAMRNVQDNKKKKKKKKIVFAENGDLKLTAYFITGKFRTFELTSNGN